MRKWETDLAGCYRSIASICKRLGISPDEATKLDSIAEKYPVCIPEYYLGLIDPGDPEDPIRKMAVPSAIEFSEGGAKDTSGEADNTVIPGMQHKYGNTVLILSTNQCAMYCRHCFRKRLVGLSSEEVAEELPLMAEYIGNHPEIDNALISGGDSFLNSTSAAYSSFLSVAAESPICLLPASTPNVISCVISGVLYKSCMVNGQRFKTLAFLSLKSLLTFPCLAVGIRGCPSIFNTYTIGRALLSCNVVCLCGKPEHTVRNAAFDNIIPRFPGSNTVPTRQNCLITALRATD